MKKLKIEKKYLDDIDFVRALIKHHDEYENIIVQRIIEDMGITTEQEKELLWDHIYNGSDWTVEIVEDES